MLFVLLLLQNWFSTVSMFSTIPLSPINSKKSYMSFYDLDIVSVQNI